jgi:SWI/SNF-related matrix-associated actin-dependent regulator 1 of chromatin subfamily A
MGLGKTRQSIVALAESAPAGPYLVICPASVKQNWRREIHAVLPDAGVAIINPAEVPAAGWSGWVIINYDLLARHEDALVKLPWAGIVFDEAHYLKNHKSKRSRIGRKLADAVSADGIIHALTGTPLTNRPRDLFPLLQVIKHPMARSFLSFAKRYCAAVRNDYGWVTDGASNLGELRTQLHGVMLRRMKDDVLDLPPKVRTWLDVDVADGTGRREARKVIEILIGARHGPQAAGMRDARGHLLAELTVARRKIAVAKVNHTIDLVEGAVTQGEKILVFTCFGEPAERITAHFGDAALMLTGETPVRDRQPLIDSFQTDDRVRVLVANIMVGGVGLNLTAARQVVFNDLDWVPANHWQAEDRAYRIGQTGTVNVSYLVAGGTIDEFVASTLATKSQLIDAVVEGAAPPESVLDALERLVTTISPRLPEASGEAVSDDAVDRLLQEVTRSFSQHTVADTASLRQAGLTPEAIAKLASALAGRPAARYLVRSASKPGVSYELEVDGADVVCSCPGFDYRGACTHARTLKAALVAGRTPPVEFEPQFP